MKIRVQQKHIDAGYSDRTGEFCPVVLALAEAGFDTPQVDDVGDIIFEDGFVQKLYCYESETIKDFVNRFDRGYEVQPFTFELDENRLWARPVPKKEK